MLNRWQGNTGRVEKIDESGFRPAPPPAAEPQREAPPPAPAAPHGAFSELGKLLPGLSEPLDSEDLILLLILYLMYRESHDSELLIIMGAMFLL